MTDEDGKTVGVLYLDFFPRATKQSGAWMTSFREQYIDGDGNDVRPLVTLTMNFSRPTDTKPSLLTVREVETFMHEFGHALHQLLSRCKYQSLSGTNVYRDFVEVPSQFNENYVARSAGTDRPPVGIVAVWCRVRLCAAVGLRIYRYGLAQHFRALCG